MAKKRRDKQNDPSTASKVAKAGVAALAIGGSAALFNNSKLSRKFKSELLPSALKTSKAIGKELRDSKATRIGLDKRNTLDDYKKAFSKGKQVYADAIKERAAGKKIKADLSKKNNLPGLIKNIEQVKQGDLRTGIKDNYKSELQKQWVNKLINKYSDKDSKQVMNLAMEAYQSIKTNTIEDRNGSLAFSDFLDGKFKKAGFSTKESQAFLTAIYNSNKEIEQKLFNSDVAIKQTYDKFKDILDKTVYESRKSTDGLFGKIDKVAKDLGFENFSSESILTGSRAMTVGDFKKYATKDNFDFDSLGFYVRDPKGKTSYKSMNVKDIIDSLKDLDDNIIFDKNIRVLSDGTFYSTAELNKISDDIFKEFSSSTLGRIFGLTDVRLDKEKSIVANFKAYSTGKEAGYEIGHKAGDTLLNTSKLAINNPSTNTAKLYETTLDDYGNLVMSDVIAEGVLRNNSHGKGARLNKEMLGTNKDILTASENKWLQKLDLEQTGAPNIFKRFKSIFDKKNSDEYGKTILQRQKKFLTNELSTEEKIAVMSAEYLKERGIEETSENLFNAAANVANLILEDNKKISSMLNNITALNQINDETISSLLHSGNIKDQSSLKILDILNSKNYTNAEELLNSIVKSTDDFIYNKDLENVYKRGLSNTDYIMNMLNISQSNTRNILGYTVETTNVMDLEQVVKREAIKEVLLRETNSGSKQGIAALETILQDSNLDLEQSKNLRYLANWSIMQTRMKLFNDIDADLSLDQIMGYGSALSNFDDLMTVSGSFRKGYTDMLDDLAARHSIFESVIGNINESYTNEYNNYSFMKKSSLSRLSQIESINDAIKILGEAGKELGAGRHDLNNYSVLTQIPQFMVARLSWGVEGFGLNLSSNSTGSTLDYIKNIGLKRVLPVVAAFSAYDYLNYESENFTGVSITGASANALANVDIAARKLAYGTGIGQIMDWFKESSVIGEYWTGSTDFQNAEERKDWYENGYTAVRGGRFWGFGSASEFRGGNIQYYQPNYLKRAHSNYHEVSVYGSAEEKFKHSWIPSLRHPLSPLRAALNPYWLEQKNMDERPYPLTGKMFSEGTPWGAILNPTVGELLKPVRMLPEVKKRLGSDGRDIKQVLKNINDRIKAKANENDDALIIDGTDIRNATYVPYGNTGDGYMNISIANGTLTSPGINFMESTDTLRGFQVPTGEIVQNYDNGQLIDKDGEMIKAIGSVSDNTNWTVNEIVEKINNAIKNAGEKLTTYNSNNSAYIPGNLPDKTQGTYVYTNAVNKMNNAYSNYYSQHYDPRMIDKNLAADYLRDSAHSIKQLSGIYNFLGEFAFGETSYKFKYADAGQMTSFSRQFWDAQAGGIGGELMEIARRFFPSEDKSIIRYNPLRNTMPEWLPERFLIGDPFTSLPKGEMRMPGKGYETLNELHPDMFGEYGAFDRFKILADIAPTSQEYKMWRNIARNTVTDPTLIKEMDEIQARANKMSGKHEFYDYRYFNNNVKMHKGVVKSINGSIVELASGEQLNLGGINLTEDADVSQILQVGEKIHYRTSADAIKRLEDGIVTNAVIYKQNLGVNTNINKTLVELGMAEKNKEDRSAIGYLANASAGQQTIGAIQEVIGHANIPILHNKYMKIETARESFLNEQVYGNSFSTWSNPIRGFVHPAFNRVSSQSMLQHAGSIAATALYMNIGKFTDQSHLKYLSGALMVATSPTALLGAGAAGIWNLGMKATKINAKTNIELGAGIGAALGSVAWGWNNAENPLKAATSFALAGETLAKYLKAESNGKWGFIAAGIGLGISAIKNPHMSKDMFRSKWIPEKTEKKYEMDEYFDRLEYVKYQGLFNQAANRAFIFEGGVNLRRIFNKMDKNKEKIIKLTRKAEKLSNKYTAGGYEYEEKMRKINAKIEALKSQRTMLKGGKYTKAAVAYKKAMDSTIYGINEGATQDEILAAVPDQYKDYFINFMNETSESERKKILKMLPEYLRRPLQIAWRQKVDKVTSNRRYFKQHALPGMGWRGWKPNVNLKHVKMKTIQNEGMLLSDFGYYESEKSKIEYHMAEGIDNYEAGHSGLSYMANMKSTLSGLGVSLQNISVEPTSAPGLWIVGDIKQTVSDTMKVGEYAVTSGIQGLTSFLF